MVGWLGLARMGGGGMQILFYMQMLGREAIGIGCGVKKQKKTKNKKQPLYHRSVQRCGRGHFLLAFAQ